MAAPENHISNYYVLKAFCRDMEALLRGSTLQLCASLSKTELLLIFEKEGIEYGIKLFLGSESFVFAADNLSLPKDRKYPFPELSGIKLQSIRAHSQDRSMRLEFEKPYTLVFQLYGRNGNALIFQGDDVLRLFKPQFSKDAERKLAAYSLSPNPGFEAYENAVKELGCEKAVTMLFPAFTSGFEAELRMEEWNGMAVQDQWLKIRKLLDELESPPYYLLPPKEERGKPQKPALLLFKPAVPADTYNNIYEASQAYASRYFRWEQFSNLHKKLFQHLKGETAKTNAVRKSAERQLAELDTEKNYRAQADIIMANLQVIPTGASEVKLHDFYQDKEIQIRLKPEVKPQKWAEKLYAKAKNQEIEREKVLEKLLVAEEDNNRLQQQLGALEGMDTVKELKEFAKSLQQEEKKTESSPFKRFVYEGYEIYVGKSAGNNDKLSFGFANKEDLWLHAKDYTGSHVVIRHKNRQPFPAPVIEKAAELAAWYSKGKNSSLCPVSYTLKKYVRKPKGAAPGAVVLEREKVILVEPRPFG